MSRSPSPSKSAVPLCAMRPTSPNSRTISNGLPRRPRNHQSLPDGTSDGVTVPRSDTTRSREPLPSRSTISAAQGMPPGICPSGSTVSRDAHGRIRDTVPNRISHTRRSSRFASEIRTKRAEDIAGNGGLPGGTFMRLGRRSSPPAPRSTVCEICSSRSGALFSKRATASSMDGRSSGSCSSEPLTISNIVSIFARQA